MASSSGSKARATKKESKALPPALDEMRTRVHVGQKGIAHATNIEDPDAYSSLGFDNAFSLEQFKNDFKIEIIESKANSMVFDMIGIDAPIANAFRRIMLSEVPSMAIDEIKLIQNTSIIQDEVLVHRLGLIPIRADPGLFDYVSDHKGIKNEANSLTFTLQIKCTRNPGAKPESAIGDQFINSTVYSRDLKWYPITKRQKKKFELNPPAAAHDDIIIAKLRPGQEIEAELYVEKGIGKTHAKWSPVSTASYRLLPEIKFQKPVEGADAEELVKKCPMGVYDIEDIGGGRKRARVANPRSCTMCRECIREDSWNERIALRRVRNHFIFAIETEGSGPPTPAAIFKESVGVLMKKCRSVLAELDTASKAQAAAKSKRARAARNAAAAAAPIDGDEEAEEAADDADTKPVDEEDDA